MKNPPGVCTEQVKLITNLIGPSKLIPPVYFAKRGIDEVIPNSEEEQEAKSPRQSSHRSDFGELCNETMELNYSPHAQDRDAIGSIELEELYRHVFHRSISTNKENRNESPGLEDASSTGEFNDEQDLTQERLWQCTYKAFCDFAKMGCELLVSMILLLLGTVGGMTIQIKIGRTNKSKDQELTDPPVLSPRVYFTSTENSNSLPLICPPPKSISYTLLMPLYYSAVQQCLKGPANYGPPPWNGQQILHLLQEKCKVIREAEAMNSGSACHLMMFFAPY